MTDADPRPGGRVSGLLLAAGAGHRLGTAKAQVLLQGTRLLDRALDVLRDSGCDEVVAVLRAPEVLTGVRVVVNPEPERGMGSSLQLGLAACTGDVVVVLLVDTPGIGADAVAAVLGAIDSGAQAAIASFRGDRRPPVAFVRELWPEVSRLADGDQGARGFLRAHPELAAVVPCDGDPADIDTAQDLARWAAALREENLGGPPR